MTIHIKPPVFKGPYIPFDVKVEGAKEGLKVYELFDRNVRIITCTKCQGKSELTMRQMVEGGTFTIIHRCKGEEGRGG